MALDGGIPDDEGILSTVDFIAAWAEHERQGARLALAARRLEQSGEWATDGSVSMAAWLRQHCRMSNRDATALVHRGRFLDTFDDIARAAVDGVLSAGQIQALRNATAPAVAPVMCEQQAELITAIAQLSVGETEQAAAFWKRRAEAIVELPEPVEPVRELRTARTTDGLVGKFVLDDHGATEFEAALRIASSWDGTEDVRSQAQRSVDAFVDIFAFFNANHHKPGTPRNRPHVEMIIDGDSMQSNALGWTTDHVLLHAPTVRTLLCDCVIRRVIRCGSTVLDYGRATRTVPNNLFRAVAARDGGCRFPGCDRPVSWCDGHHLVYWEHDGPTSIHNVGLFCNRHHHFIHRNNIGVKLLPNADFEFSFADGSTRLSHPRAPPGLTA